MTNRPAPSPITKPSRPLSKGREAFRSVVVAAGQRPRRRETGETDAIDRCLRTATHGNVRLTCADQPGCVADRLNPGGTGGNRCAQRPFEAMLDRYMTSREIDQKRWNGERRQTPRTTAVGGTHRIGNGPETTDTRADDCCGPLLAFSVRRMPAGLLQRLPSRFHGKHDEAIHLLLFLGRRRTIRIKSGLGVFLHRRHTAADPGRQISHHSVRQITQPGTPGQQTLPDDFNITAQR